MPPGPTLLSARLLLADHAFDRSATYDLVLLAHVAAVVVSFIALAVAGGSAHLLGRRGAGHPDGTAGLGESLVRYYRPGVNWAGRAVMAVPVLGIVLVFMSNGYWHFSDPWIGVGLVVWLVVAGLDEAVLWPAERLVQRSVHPSDQQGPDGDDATIDRMAALRRIVWCSTASVVLLAVAVVVMVAKP